MVKSNLNYGIIGNCQILAMVSHDASIDWTCFPRFDSPSVFARLLDEKLGGCFSIQPEEEDYSSEQFYQRNTNILVTRFITSEGVFEVHDFAPRFALHERYFRPSAIYRIVRLISGNPRLIVKCDPRPDYARKAPDLKVGSNHIDYGDDLRLTTSTPLSYILEQKAFKLNSDQYFVLTYGAPLESGLKFTAEEFYERTKNYWETWVKSSNIGELYQDEVIRAALALKLHYFHDTGAFIAATTTSLPESDQSTRNWDYRYCWLRDAYFTIRALDMLGKFTEKEKFHSYLSNIIHSDLHMQDNGHLQPVYSVSGDRELHESELDHLAGFLNNKPVRIGNDAYTHKQFDVYGEMVYCLAPIFYDRRLISYDHDELFIDFKILVEKSIELFNQPDAGIWEFRSDEGVHTFSQIFCWGAADQGAKVAAHLGHVDLASRWTKKAAEMKEIILREAWNE
ncbi:MAG: glycoside hydrolase family 15 protein, partial [Candidatus Melainabacteria bacterium]|nr:glycoside hydrolase family 15 protein [Candidatus Melainabacteria bacterium]